MVPSQILSELISRVSREDVQEILIHSFNGLFFRKGSQWFLHNEMHFNKETINEMLKAPSNINSAQKKDFIVCFRMENLYVKGYKIYEKEDVILIIRWINEKNISQDVWDFSENFYQVLKKSSGITIIHGRFQSGKSTVLQVLLQKLVNEKKMSVLIYDEFQGHSVGFQENTIELSTDQFINMAHFPFSADYIFIDSMDVRILEKAHVLARSGFRVILTVVGDHPLEILSDFKGVEYLSALLHVKLIPGRDTPLVPAHELILVTPEIRKILRKSIESRDSKESKDMDWDKSVKELTSSVTGALSMNQSILQLLLKRKIDWNMGFEESPRPDELDLLLKQIGI